MKRFSAIHLCLFMLAFSAYAEEVEYNYYQRTYFGEYEIQRLPADELSGISLLRYVGQKTNDALTKVTGYYGTGQLKFIDILRNSRIIETTYFSPEGEIVFKKKYSYQDGKAVQIVVETVNSQGKRAGYLEEYRYKDDGIDFYRKITEELGPDATGIMETSGKLPHSAGVAYLKTQTYIQQKPNNRADFEQMVEYDAKGRMSRYVLSLSGADLEIHEYYYDLSGALELEAITNIARGTYSERRREDNQYVEYIRIDDGTFRRTSVKYEKVDYFHKIFIGYKQSRIVLGKKAGTTDVSRVRTIDYGDESHFQEYYQDKLYEEGRIATFVPYQDKILGFIFNGGYHRQYFFRRYR